jgi:hypothetical protein
MTDRDFDPKDGGYIQIMNEFADKMMTYRLDKNEWSILWFLIRMTWGMQGRPWADFRWKTIREKTQLPNSSLVDAMKKLKYRNIVHTLKNNKQITRYKINSKLSTWKDPSELIRSVHRPKLLDRSTDLIGSVHRPKLDRPTDLTPFKDSIIKTVSKDTPRPPKKKKAEKHVPSGSELKNENPWIDEAAWDDFVTHRENIKHPLTPLAISKSVNFLKKYQEFQQMIVDTTIINNWRGLFPPKVGTSSTVQAKHERKMEKWKRRYNEKYR